MRFSSTFRDCMWTSLGTPIVMVIRGLKIQQTIFKSLDEGVVFVGFFFYGNIGESIMKLGEFYELYGVRWVCGDGCTAIYGASKMHKMSGYSEALHVHVLGGHVHCVHHHGIVLSWG